MKSRGALLLLLAVAILALAVAGGATAGDENERGIDPNQGRSLVEITLPSKADAIRLQLNADQYGVEFNDHYLRTNANGSVTVTVFGTEGELETLEAGGYRLGVTIEGPEIWRERVAERQAEVTAEARADAAALGDVGIQSHEDEIVVLRVDYFESYAGRFLSVEAKDRLGGAQPTGGIYTGPSLSLSFNSGAGTALDAPPRTINTNIDTDTTPDTYIEHRELVRIGDAGTTSPAAPTLIRIGSSTGESAEAPVNLWLGGGLPPMKGGFLKDFTTHYMDPTEVYQRLGELAAEFPDISELITLPHKTNGYQRRAQAMMSGTTAIGSTPGGTTAQSQAVVLTTRAWGHEEGGNDVTAEFRNPFNVNAPLTVTAVGKDIVVNLGTNASGQLSSTASQVVSAINSQPAASALVVALTYRGNAGGGIVQPHAKVNLSDFLDEGSSDNVQRGPFEYSVLRIGKKRDGKQVGVFLYCQQHAREWATPLTCIETAEQLLRNYGIDKRTKALVDH